MDSQTRRTGSDPNPLEIPLVLDLVIKHLDSAPPALLSCREVNLWWNQLATKQLTTLGWSINLSTGKRVSEYERLLRATQDQNDRGTAALTPMNLHVSTIVTSDGSDSGDKDVNSIDHGVDILNLIDLHREAPIPTGWSSSHQSIGIKSITCHLSRLGLDPYLQRRFQLVSDTLSQITLVLIKVDSDSIPAPDSDDVWDFDGGMSLPQLKTLRLDTATPLEADVDPMDPGPSPQRDRLLWAIKIILTAAHNLESIQCTPKLMEQQGSGPLFLTNITMTGPTRVKRLTELDVLLREMLFLVAAPPDFQYQFSNLRVLKLSTKDPDEDNAANLFLVLQAMRLGVLRLIRKKCPALVSLEITALNNHVGRDNAWAAAGAQPFLRLSQLTHFGYRLKDLPETGRITAVALASAKCMTAMMHGFSNLRSVVFNMETCIALGKLYRNTYQNAPPPPPPPPLDSRFPRLNGLTTLTIDVGHAAVPSSSAPYAATRLQDVIAVIKTITTSSHNSGGSLPELYIAFRNGVKWVRRIVEDRVEYVRPLQLPPTERYTLLNPESGSFSDFKIVPTSKQRLEDGQIEVAVRAASLNFKDVLVALSSTDSQELLDGGRGSVMADGHIQDVVKELGLDFAGVVTRIRRDDGNLRVGDRVFGFTPGGLGGALASHVVVPVGNVCLMRPGCSFESQAALPAILLTVHYFLVQKARIRSGDRVLVHTGSGGVGLLAIQVAQAFGAEVYATAGSVRKRNYLRHFMNVSHVYSSRSTDFGALILKDTEGKGVTIVLNSLTGPGFKEASLSACAPAARFLEMSKLNIWSAEQVRALRPDVSYFVQDVSRLMGSMRSQGSNQDNQLLHEAFGDYQEVFHFWKELSERSSNDRSSFVLRELPVTRFTLTRVHDAFRYLQSAKHIGKVVIKMPVTSVKAGAVVHKEDLFNGFGTYLITGGLGGIGLEVAKWMVGSGAQYLVLMSRSPPNTATEALIDKLRTQPNSGATGQVQVLVVQGDVGEYAQCERMLQEIEAAGFPALRGIMHAAGVIPGVGKDKDNPEVSPALGKQTTGTYLTAARPKVHGTWNLHLLTLRHYLTLDHFVLFSSVVTTLGGFGQANYVAANRYLDAFVGYRRSLGLPCSSISWGSWSDVGAAKEFVIGMARAFGLQHFTPCQGLASLERVLLSPHRPSAIVVNISNPKLVKQTVRQGRLLDLISSTELKSSLTPDWYERKIREIHDAKPGAGRTELIKDYLEATVRSALKLNEAELIDPDTDLRELGVDSLMSMELRSKLHSLLKDVVAREVTITLQSFMEARTLNKLATMASEMLNDDGANGPRSKCLTHDELITLVQKDCVLPKEICLPTPIWNELSVPSEWKHILLTGATGQLGIFILSELTRAPPASRLIVHCLIRAKSNQAAEARLKETLANYNLLETTHRNLDRVVCVAGDVSQLQFGLSDDNYGALANTIDAVLHSAAKVNHVAPYGEFGPEDLRSTNVVGLLNVLRFVVTGKVKPLQFESTNGIVPIVEQNADEDDAAGSSALEALLPDDYWGQAVFSHGYFLSKFVCEKLLHEAALGRGLQITLTRHHYLSTDTKSGGLLATAGTNHALLLALACQRVKAVPDSKVHLTMVPADVAGRVSASLFLDDRTWTTSSGLGIYAINNPTSVHVSELREFLCNMGAETRLLPYEEWREAVLGFGSGTTTELAPLADFYTSDLFSSNLVTKSEIWRQLTSDKPDLSNSVKIKALVPNIDQLMPHPLELMLPYLDRYENALY